jgi:hypothetical protein
MSRPISAVLSSLAVLANLLAGGVGKAQYQYVEYKLQSTRDAGTFVSLIQQSHDLDNLLSPSMRVWELIRQAQMVSSLNPDLGREWAQELFALSLQMKSSRRSQVQSTALDILIRLDPDRALDLLHQLSPEDPEAKSVTWPPQTQLAHRVFGVLATRDGENALPVLQQEADRMGLQGHYPYAALGYASTQATNKYWGNDNPRAIRILESVFQPAYARYRLAPRTYLDDYEFGGMLEVFAGGLPFDSVQPALHLLVKNLLATDTSKYQFTAEVINVNGQSAVAHNAIDAAIFLFGSIINRDPDLANELASSRPQLQKGLEFTKEGQQRSSVFGPAVPVEQGQTAGANERYQDAVGLSFSNPTEAIAMAEQLPDDTRTIALLQVARMVSRYDPTRAAAVIAEVQQESKPPINEMTLVDIISAQAFVAAGQNNQSALHDLLRQGFAAANHMLLEEEGTRRNYVSVPALSPLVQIAMENDPDFTIPFVEGLPASRVKAEVLLDAAHALGTQGSPHIGAPPPQSAEKPNS